MDFVEMFLNEIVVKMNMMDGVNAALSVIMCVSFAAYIYGLHMWATDEKEGVASYRLEMIYLGGFSFLMSLFVIGGRYVFDGFEQFIAVFRL